MTVSVAYAANKGRGLELLPGPPPFSLPGDSCDPCLLCHFYALSDSKAPSCTVFCAAFPSAGVDAALRHVSFADIFEAQAGASS